MKITMLGTGMAVVKKCYNTCFVIEDEGKYFMVDAGGGNQILSLLDKAKIDWRDIHDIFVTHKHIDHIMGVIWLIRLYCQNMADGKYDGEVNIYAHEEVISILKEMATLLLVAKQTKFIGEKLHLVTVNDGETKEIIGRKVTFFDIGSTKAKQYGFTYVMGSGEKLTCLGDEPYNERNEKYAKNAKWLLHEAFCLYSQRERFNPYKKSHSTAMDACKNASLLGVKNLIMYHTEEENLENRKALYLAEGRPHFDGNIFIPDDLETIELE